MPEVNDSGWFGLGTLFANKRMRFSFCGRGAYVSDAHERTKASGGKNSLLLSHVSSA
jgi:hypothetical protein